MKPDEFHGEGGSFILKDGKRTRVEEPTKPTDTGGARDADGTSMAGTTPPVADAVEAAATEPAAPRVRRALTTAD